jgi:hypothetical protein
MQRRNIPISFVEAVFINTSLNPAIIVTVYRTSQIQKYWSDP